MFAPEICTKGLAFSSLTVPLFEGHEYFGDDEMNFVDGVVAQATVLEVESKHSCCVNYMRTDGVVDGDMGSVAALEEDHGGQELFAYCNVSLPSFCSFFVLIHNSRAARAACS